MDLKLIFWPIELRQRPNFDTSQKAVFLHFSVKYKFVTKNCSNCEESRSSCAVSKKLKEKDKFSENFEQTTCRLAYYQQKVKLQVASRVAGRLKTHDLWKQGDFEKIPKMFGTECDLPARYLKGNVSSQARYLTKISHKPLHGKTYFTCFFAFAYNIFLCKTFFSIKATFAVTKVVKTSTYDIRTK